jgi:hypothetical protein
MLYPGTGQQLYQASPIGWLGIGTTQCVYTTINFITSKVCESNTKSDYFPLSSGCNL